MRRLVAVALLAILLGTAMGQGGNRIPGFQVEDAIWPPAGQDGGQFGRSVATDGERLVIGAPGEGNGAVYVYTREGSTWSLEARIPDQGTASFGAEVAIGDGRIFVGVPDAANGLLNPAVGRVEVFEGAPQWRHVTSWTCPDALVQGRCGEAIAVSDGRVYVGQPGNTLQDLNRGRVHMLDATTLNLQHTHMEADADGLRFGAAVDVDGDHIVVGAPARLGTDEVVPGGAFFYERHGSNWLAKAEYRADPDLNTAETFGQNVAIDHPDALVTTVTQYDVDTGVYFGGDALFYEHDGNDWKFFYWESTELQAMALHNGTAVIGAWFWDELFVYTKHIDSWHWAGWLGGWHWGGDENYGFDIAYEDRMIVVGAPDGERNNRATGGAYAYYDNWHPWAYAGQDRRIDDLDGDGKEVVTLDGSGSWDRDGEIVAYRWYMDGTYVGGQERVEVELPIGNYTARLEVEDDVGALDQDTVRIQVRVPVTEADFRWLPSDFITTWTTLWFQDFSSDLRAPIKEWSWDFDEDRRPDSTQRQPYHRYELGGPHDVTLTTTNLDGGTLKATKTVQVRDSDPVAFGGWSRVIYTDETGLSATTTLDGSASYDDKGITSWSWWDNTREIGDEPQVEATFPRGANSVTLEVWDQRGQWDRQRFTVLAVPGDANETAINRPGPAFDYEQVWERTYEFWAVNSGNPAIAQWDFNNDGEPDAEGTWVWHEFDAPGEHTVRFTVINEEGAKEVSQETVPVKNRPPDARFWPDHAVVPQGAYLVFTGPARDEAPLASWEWTFGDGGRSDHTDVGHRFDTLGDVPVTLEVQDDGGLKDTHEGTVTVVSLDEWEAQFGDFQQDVLINATKEDAPAALEPPKPRGPTFSATETYDPPVVTEQEDDGNKADQDFTWMGIPLWIPAVLLLLLLAVLLVVLPMRRR